MSVAKKIVKLPANARPKAPTKGKAPKVKKLPEVEENNMMECESVEPKKRASRAKKQPTKEELIKMLSDSSNELKQIMVDLKEDECKLQGLQLKKVPELLKETLSNLEEDQKEIDDKVEELKSLPEEKEE